MGGGTGNYQSDSLIGLGAGIIPWPSSYARQFIRDYTPKSVGLNAPPEIRTAGAEAREDYWNRHPDVFEKYWAGELARKGNNPLVFLNIENGGFNCMSFPNPGVKSILDEILISEPIPIRLSIFGQDEGELKHIIKLTKDHEAYSRIKSFEINVSCPNVKPGECASSNDLERITNYISAVREETDRELIVKLSPLVDGANFIEAIIESGADAINLSNTIPGRAYNGYTGEELLSVGGVNGPIIFDRMLKNISDTYQTMKEIDQFIPIYASGGITDKTRALLAIKAGASFIDLGYALKDFSEREIGVLVREIDSYLMHFDLDKVKGSLKVSMNPEYWDDPDSWIVNPNGSRQLKVTSWDHKPNKVVRSTRINDSNYYLVRFDEPFAEEFKPGEYITTLMKIGDWFQERPFTILDNKTLLVNRVGVTSDCLTSIPNTPVYVRGPLGNGLDVDGLGDTLAIGGGCGAAAIAPLTLQKKCDTILSFKHKGDVVLDDILSDYITRIHVDTEAGSVLPVEDLSFHKYDDLVLCGPNPMMFNAALAAVKQGMSPENIHLITESIFKCFNGLCGACDCGGIRLCTEGPVVPLSKVLELAEFVIRDSSGQIKTDKVSQYIYDRIERIKELV